ncbi:hypothetical protein ACIP4R_41125 [Streptomyces echinatus]|uniref:hypothetical protein n=1 Tax=Streptomyces echinatus TaxID=67293 RepID=UPI00382D5724
MREIAKETGLNRRTVSKYLADPASVAPPKREAAGRARPTGPRTFPPTATASSQGFSKRTLTGSAHTATG